MSKFAYKKIDEVPNSFFEGVMNEGGFVEIPNRKIKVNVNGKPVTINIQVNRTLAPLWTRYSKHLGDKTISGQSTKAAYDPIDADEKFHANPNRNVYFDADKLIAEGTAELTPEQIRTRVLTFVKILQMVTSESIAEYIAQVAPKKKDGSLYLKRIVHIATCFCQRDDLKMYELYAQAKKDNELVITTRLETHASVGVFDDDLIVKTDLFRTVEDQNINYI